MENSQIVMNFSQICSIIDLSIYICNKEPDAYRRRANNYDFIHSYWLFFWLLVNIS